MRNDDNIIEIDLLRIFETLLAKIWIIIIVAFIGAGITFSYANFMITPMYQSSAMFYVNNNNLSFGGTSFSISSSDISASQSLVDTYIVILKTRNTLETVIEKSNLPYTYGQLSGMVSASSVNGTEVFRVTVTSPNPVEACKIANGIAEVLPDKIAEIVTGSGAKVVDYAVVNASKVSPSVKRYTLIGLLAGAALAAVIIILEDIFDDTIRDDDYLLNTYHDIPTLAVIPNLFNEQSNSYYNYAYKYGAYYAKPDDNKKQNSKELNK